MGLTYEQKLLLISTGADEAIASATTHAPERLAQEMVGLGLVERIGQASAWRLSLAWIEARRELVGE